MGNLIAHLQIRGGEVILEKVFEEYLEMAYPNCIVGQGFRYINNKRLRKIIYALCKKSKIVDFLILLVDRT